MTDQEKIYKKGFIDGMRCFAWWKDGKELCGTSETPLINAIQDVEKMHNYNPPKDQVVKPGGIESTGGVGAQ